MTGFPILGVISSSWWMLALRGVVAILFALCAFLWPGLTLATLVLLWGAFAVVDGMAAVIGGIQARWWSVVIFGLLGIAFGGFTLFRPDITARALLIVIAIWVMARGAFDIVAAIALRKEISNEWLLILGGLVSVALGVVMAAFPGAGAVALAWLIGIQAMVLGILFLALAFRLRGYGPASGPRLGA